MHTHCKGHTHTGSPSTCRSLGRGLGTRLTPQPPHTEYDYYTCEMRQQGRKREKREKGGSK